MRLRRPLRASLQHQSWLILPTRQKTCKDRRVTPPTHLVSTLMVAEAPVEVAGSSAEDWCLPGPKSAKIWRDVLLRERLALSLAATHATTPSATTDITPRFLGPSPDSIDYCHCFACTRDAPRPAGPSSGYTHRSPFFECTRDAPVSAGTPPPAPESHLSSQAT